MTYEPVGQVIMAEAAASIYNHAMVSLIKKDQS